ncbi:MAG TPA: tyrosine-type recombinase/integrase [Acidimicrobiales bacterium]|nr:tyrosine-type recombinase/integrase [Acidimicrobiales bacterium]
MASIEKRTTDGGVRYDVRWHEPGGRARRKTFRLRRDADAWRRQVEQAETAGVVVDPRARKTLLADVAARWLAANPAKRGSSRALDEAILRNHVLPALGGRPVGSITRADVQGLVNRWAAADAASTVARRYSCLRALLSFAEADELIARSPCRGVKLPTVRLVDRPTLNAGQLEAVAAALGEHAPMMWLGAVLGLRWGEVAGLAAADVDVEARTVTVRRQLGRDGKLGPPKSVAGLRRLAVPGWLAELLEPLAAGKAPDGLVFTSTAGGPLEYHNWRSRVWRPACEQAGVPDLRFHDLRSMAATALVMAGVDVKTAQSRLGHSTPAMTLGLYARVTADADRAAADAVGEHFRPSRAISAP